MKTKLIFLIALFALLCNGVQGQGQLTQAEKDSLTSSQVNHINKRVYEPPEITSYLPLPEIQLPYKDYEYTYNPETKNTEEKVSAFQVDKEDTRFINLIFKWFYGMTFGTTLIAGLIITRILKKVGRNIMPTFVDMGAFLFIGLPNIILTLYTLYTFTEIMRYDSGFMLFEAGLIILGALIIFLIQKIIKPKKEKEVVNANN